MGVVFKVEVEFIGNFACMDLKQNENFRHSGLFPRATHKQLGSVVGNWAQPARAAFLNTSSTELYGIAPPLFLPPKVLIIWTE